MNDNELRERYIRLAFQYVSAIDALLTKGLVDVEAASAAKERFYDTLNEEKLRATQKIRDYHETICLYMRILTNDGMISLTELAKQYSDESPGYMIQSWMRSRVVSRVMRKFDLALAEIYFRGRVHAPWLPSSGQGAKGQGRRYAARLALDAL